MRINGYRCDTCGKEHLFHPLIGLTSNGVPLGWFTVKVAAFLTGPTWIFCSTTCLSQWSSNRLREESEKALEREVSQ